MHFKQTLFEWVPFPGFRVKQTIYLPAFPKRVFYRLFFLAAFTSRVIAAEAPTFKEPLLLKTVPEAFKEIASKAEQGDGIALNQLGAMYLKGVDVERDAQEAVRIFRHAVGLGSVAAANNLGSAFLQGQGITPDLDEASKWFRLATTMASGTATSGAHAENPVAEIAPVVLAGSEAKSRCPNQRPPHMPREAIQANLEGTVHAKLFSVDGVPKDVVIVSGPQVFHSAVRKAMLSYECLPLKGAVFGSQEFVFRIQTGVPRVSAFVVRSSNMVLAPWQISFHTDWTGLSLEQRQAVRRAFPELPTSDEPPYPASGLQELLEDIRTVAQKLEIPGLLQMKVRVGKSGAAESVNVEESPDPRLNAYVAAVVARARYKPASCSGQPCDMDFPIEVAVLDTDAKKKGDFSGLMRQLEVAANAGKPQAQNALGESYEYGRMGLTRDDVKALHWYRLSASQKDAAGQNNLARMLEAGRGVPIDLPSAAELYRSAADQGYAPAQNNLAFMLQNAKGIPLDLAEALRLYRLSADQGYALAERNLGLMHERGQGVKQNFDEAFRLYKSAADRGNGECLNFCV